MTENSRPSLYARLGGVYAIAVVVDDFIDRVMGDARLNVPAGEREDCWRSSAAPAATSSSTAEALRR